MIKIDIANSHGNAISSDGEGDSTDPDLIRIKIGSKCGTCEEGILKQIGGGADGSPQGSSYSSSLFQCNKCDSKFKFIQIYKSVGVYKTLEFSFSLVRDWK